MQNMFEHCHACKNLCCKQISNFLNTKQNLRKQDNTGLAIGWVNIRPFQFNVEQKQIATTAEFRFGNITISNIQ